MGLEKLSLRQRLNSFHDIFSTVRSHKTLEYEADKIA